MIASRRNCSSLSTLLMGAAALGVSALVQPAVADVITSFSVGPDQTLTYPTTGPSALTTLPDEHTTFLPMPTFLGPTTYLVFAASNVGTGGLAGTVALQTSDLTNFTIGYAALGPCVGPR